MDEITSELGKLKMDVIGLTETKRKVGTEIVRDYVHLYSRVSKDRRAERGVSILINKKFKKGITNWEAVTENVITININHLGTKITVLCVYALSNNKVNLEKVQFYKKLNEMLVNIGTTREIILLGDYNGHTDTKVNNQVVGLYGETRINDNGEHLIDLCESHILRITNGYFKHKRIHKYMWEQHI